MRKYETDYRQWGQFFALFFLPPFFLGSVVVAIDLWNGHRADVPSAIAMVAFGAVGAAARWRGCSRRFW